MHLASGSSPTQAAVAAFGAGLPVIVCDDDDREGEADVADAAGARLLTPRRQGPELRVGRPASERCAETGSTV